MQSLESQAASSASLSGVLPIGFGPQERVLQDRQRNVTEIGSVYGNYALNGSDVNAAELVGKFRSNQCQGLSDEACSNLVDQALADQKKRAVLLAGISSAAPLVVNGPRSLLAKGRAEPAGQFSTKPANVGADEDLPDVYVNQKQGTYSGALPIQRIVFNGVELDPALPPPVAGYDYFPGMVKNPKTDAQAYSHWTGFQNEIKLANDVAALGQTVIKWGGPVGAQGNDVISVSINTGEVYLWDGKYRSNPTNIEQSPTFANKATRDNAINEAKDAILSSKLPDSVKVQAIKNLDAGNFTTNTVGAGAAKNSTQVRYCGNKPC